jgi:hypothetical protein
MTRTGGKSSGPSRWPGTGTARALALSQERSMPRYFFSLHVGIQQPDPIGSEHPDLAGAREEAVHNFAERMRESKEKAFLAGS